MNIYVIPNQSKPEAIECSKSVEDELKKHGCNVFVDREKDTSYGFTDVHRKHMAESDIVIAIGGDATALRTAKACAEFEKPVLGINAGRLGFMTGLERSELALLSKLTMGDYTIEERMMLDVELYSEDGTLQFRENALNDAVISRGSQSKILDLDIMINDRSSMNCRADGVIISTPTGSTAYALSAGGPIIDPRLCCIELTPVCSHALFSRPVLFSSDTKLSVFGNYARNKGVFLTVDGESDLPVEKGGHVDITMSSSIAKLIKIHNDSFYDVLINKFKD